ncbi:MAG: hypothetical protein JXA08_04915 [Methanomicrobiaceae archaeon]|nr:hypothetical protein [Methanomicrobiaceae archaeon]
MMNGPAMSERTREMLIVAAVALVSCMAGLDISIVNIALPSLSRHLNASTSMVSGSLSRTFCSHRMPVVLRKDWRCKGISGNFPVRNFPARGAVRREKAWERFTKGFT